MAELPKNGVRILFKLKSTLAHTSIAGSLEIIGCADKSLSHLSNPFLLDSAKSESTALTKADSFCGGNGGTILWSSIIHVDHTKKKFPNFFQKIYRFAAGGQKKFAPILSPLPF